MYTGQIDNKVVSYPSRGRGSVFCFKPDTTVSYAVGIGEEFRNNVNHRLNSPSQFTFDTTRVNVRILDSAYIDLDMIPTKNSAYKQKITLVRKK